MRPAKLQPGDGRVNVWQSQRAHLRASGSQARPDCANPTERAGQQQDTKQSNNAQKGQAAKRKRKCEQYEHVHDTSLANRCP
jgi:hypothetical protein